MVTDKIKESEKVTSFYFRQKDESEEMPDLFKAGQYLSFRLPRGTFVGIDHDVVRNYSISCGPGQSQFRISVKRKLSSLPKQPQGLVSNYFHDNVEIGSVVEVMSIIQNYVLTINSSSTYSLLLFYLSSFENRRLKLIGKRRIFLHELY